MQKVKYWGIALLIIGSVAAFSFMGYVISKEPKKPVYEFVGTTGKKFKIGDVTYVEVILRDKATGQTFSNPCPCIVGSICFPACTK